MGCLPALMLWRTLGAAGGEGEAAAATAMARPLALTVVWSAMGLWLFLRGKLKVIAKFWVSLGLMGILLWVIFDRSQTQEVMERLVTISLWWMAGAFLVKGTGMAATVWRWKVLLEAQDLKVPLRHLIGTFLIGRFVGSFLPSTVGLDGYRMWDIARHSGQAARSISVIVVEKIIGFFVLSTLVVATIPWGIRFVPPTALVATALLFAVPVTLSFGMLLQPRLIRRYLSRLLPPDTAIGAKVAKAVRAVTAYESHRRALIKAVGIGFIVHLGTVMMYYFTAHSIGVNVGLGEILYVGPLMITATVVPVSVAGIGVRELVISQLMGQVGHPEAAAVVFAFLGYLVGEIISLFGGFVLLARRSEYKVVIAGKAMESTEEEEELPPPPVIPAHERPRLADYVLTGLGGGIAAGLLLGIGEAALVVGLMQPPRDFTVLGWAAVASGLVWAGAGTGLGLLLWMGGRLLGLRRTPRADRYVFVVASLFCAFGFVVSWFRLYRDVFREGVRPQSPMGLLTLGALAVGFAIVFFLMRWALRRLALSRAGRLLLRPWGTPLAGAAAAALLVVVSAALTEDQAHANGTATADPSGRPNVVLVMVDTLRADHLSLYGYGRETTPQFEALAQESVVFRNAFAQASWTRPSVATILTGRYPSSHQAVTKPDGLPDEVETLAEVLRAEGYRTGAVVTNYNLAPYFNFHQGFDDYTYLEPQRLLWADDNAAKLALYELLRRVAVRFPRRLTPDQFYQDAEVTTDAALDWLQEVSPSAAPYFLFVTYMDPHDPYFRRPLDGYAIGRSFNAHPSAEQADELRELYDGEITYWDSHLGRLLASLRQRPDWHRTIVVVCSDHGEEFFEHGGWYHGTTLYDEQLWVPLVVRLPDSELGGAVEDRWVGLIDIAPTMARLAGAVVPEGMRQGHDLFSVAGTEGAPRRLFAEEDHEGNRLRSVRFRQENEDWKYIEANADNRRGLEPQELYELRQDRGEQNNLALRQTDRLSQATTHLEQVAEEAHQGAASRSQVGLTADSVEQLRRLGYMNDGE
jgi:arylsulfatase A-like enzyme/uncharacterized membrane protein YbhN (UPF0104 family)